MIKLKQHSLLALFLMMGTLAFLTTGCNKDGCIDPNAVNYDPDATKDDGNCTYDTGQLTLHFHSRLGAQDLVLNQTYTVNGRATMFSAARFYVSGIQLGQSGTNTPVNEYLHVNPATMDYPLGTVDAGSYDRLTFNIGVDSVANHSDPSTYAASHALSNQSAIHSHWSWNSGYRFIVLEGMVDTSAAGNGPADFYFEMHIGSDDLLRTVDLATNYTITAGQNYTLDLNIDFLQFLDGVDLRTDNTTHTMDNMPLAMQVTNNAVSAITVQ